MTDDEPRPEPGESPDELEDQNAEPPPDRELVRPVRPTRPPGHTLPVEPTDPT